MADGLVLPTPNQSVMSADNSTNPPGNYYYNDEEEPVLTNPPADQYQHQYDQPQGSYQHQHQHQYQYQYQGGYQAQYDPYNNYQGHPAGDYNNYQGHPAGDYNYYQGQATGDYTNYQYDPNTNYQYDPNFNPHFPTDGLVPDLPAEFENEDAFKPTPEQKEILKAKLRDKFRHRMPFDWLGQMDFDWYSSWFMKQEHFVAFRVGLTLFAANCWWNIVKVFYGHSWANFFEITLDPTSFFRYSFTIFALTCLMIGIGGSTLLSLAKLYMSHKSFKILCQYKIGKDFGGGARSFIIFSINHLYDAGMIFAVVPFVLIAIPDPILFTKVSLSLWNTLMLPMLVLTDAWITKRCRHDSAFISRHLPIVTLLLFIFGFFGMTFSIIAMELAFGIHRQYIFIKDEHYPKWIHEYLHPAIRIDDNFFVGIAQNLILFVIYRIIDKFGVEWIHDFYRFKANYLLAYHSAEISMKDVNDLAKLQEKHYMKKADAVAAQLAEAHAKLMEQVAEMNNGEEVNSSEVEAVIEETDNGAGVSFGTKPNVVSNDKEDVSEEAMHVPDDNDEISNDEMVDAKTADDENVSDAKTADDNDQIVDEAIVPDGKATVSDDKENVNDNFANSAENKQ